MEQGFPNPAVDAAGGNRGAAVLPELEDFRPGRRSSVFVNSKASGNE
jgi:hypothetical protein